MSVIGKIRTRLRKWVLRHLALPLLNRELKEQGLHFYRYVPSSDRLFPYRELTRENLHRERAGTIPADRWYRTLSDLRLRVPVAFDVGVNYGHTSTWLSRWAGPDWELLLN